MTAPRKRPARPKPASKNKKPKRAPTKTSWQKGKSGNSTTKWEAGCETPNPKGANQWPVGGLYKPEYAEQAAKLCRLGATNAVLADFFGVGMTTISNWIASNEEFYKALQEGRDSFDDMVERSFAQRAIGYDYKTEKVFNYQGEVVRAEVREHVPADTTAAMKWLSIRRKDTWSDAQRVELTGKDGGPIETESKSDVEIARRIAFALARGDRSRREETIIEHDG